ncbi:hypothetical protein R1sor_001156 [Riccia sorocarpa]|uniref:Uncharacterized protein n=1 Tax=Riccia sorocarpa TaxID=122646 RepID=A0ABD3H165_9MARC
MGTGVVYTNGLFPQEFKLEREDIRQTKQHEAERWAAAKKPAKDKGKVVVISQPKKEPVTASQAPREKLLGSSINAEKARLSHETQSQAQNRESKNDYNKHKCDSVTPTPPLKVCTPPTKVESSSEEEESDSSEREREVVDTSDHDDDSDSPPATQTVTKKGVKWKTLNQIDKSHIDKEKQEIRREAIEAHHNRRDKSI